MSRKYKFLVSAESPNSGLGMNKPIYMSVKKQIADLFGTYFITITCHNWLDLFDITKSYKTVYNWFDYLKKNYHFINGYVIMPNHLHALISFSNSGKKINLFWRKRLACASMKKTLHLLYEPEI